MKRILLAIIASGLAISMYAQSDSTKTETESPKGDTIKIGGVIIIRKSGKNDTTGKSIVISNKKKSNARISTNWWIPDVGFANYNDNTDYSASLAQGFTGPGVNEDAMKLRTGKSVNVNVWLFMQRIRIVKGINLKYGLGAELYNFRFDDERIRFQENPTSISLDETYKGLKKNKLAADYVTVPMMLNFNFTPDRKQGFGFSAGISGGYLFASRQKIKNGDKSKLRDDFDLRKWKVAYIGELNLGPVRLYGSYALKSMWEKGLDQTPYAVGVRFSHF
jgi:hypothetical protein